MRRALTFVVVAAVTAIASTSWLYDGDVLAAVAPVVPVAWNADQLAAEQGIVPAAAALPSAPLPVPPDEEELEPAGPSR